MVNDLNITDYDKDNYEEIGIKNIKLYKLVREKQA